jgi:hypothetical protein
MRFEARFAGRGSIDPSQRIVLDHSCRFDRMRIEQASFGAGREAPDPSDAVDALFRRLRLAM